MPFVESLIDRTDLIPEGIQELDGVNHQDRVHAARGSLQVGKDILAEKVNNIYKRVGRCDPELQLSAL